MDSPQIYDYFFSFDSEQQNDGLNITWAHAVNSQRLLSESINGTLQSNNFYHFMQLGA